MINVFQFFVAIVWSAFVGLADGIYIMGMAMLEIPFICLFNGCWPWECYGGIEIHDIDE